MFNFFDKNSRVKTGKVTVSSKMNPDGASAPAEEKEKKRSPVALVGNTWKKFNSMDRKQAYTWGSVLIVTVVGILLLSSLGASPEQEDFSDFESRGYDLANMPFSSDEAEQYLLAAKYPDMKDSFIGGLYSQEEKEARQAEDAEDEAYEGENDSNGSDGYGDSSYGGSGYYGGSGGGSRTPTQVNTLGEANIKGGNGAGLGSTTFGPSGDFSNFRSQDKGGDKAPTQGPGSGDAKKALFQSAMGSRAAAGLKNDKLLNAKRAMMGGNVKGSEAFMSDSGAVDLSKAAGLDLDTNAPVSSADLNGLGDKVNPKAKEREKEETSTPWWQQMLQDMVKAVVQGFVQMGVEIATAGPKALAQARADAKVGAYLEKMAKKKGGTWQIKYDNWAKGLGGGGGTNSGGNTSGNELNINGKTYVEKN